MLAAHYPRPAMSPDPSATDAHGPHRWARPAARRWTAVALVALVATVAACGSSGRELREVPAGQTAPTRSTVATTPPIPSTAATTGLVLVPEGWSAGGELPVATSCDGDGLSPPLSIAGVAPGTVELALIVVDPDADGFVHWIVTGMAPVAVTLPVGAPPPGTEGPNGAGGTGWFPLCPPPGETHVYELEVLAFTAAPTLAGAVGPDAIVEALRSQSSARALLTGTFQR